MARRSVGLQALLGRGTSQPRKYRQHLAGNYDRANEALIVSRTGCSLWPTQRAPTKLWSLPWCSTMGRAGIPTSYWRKPSRCRNDTVPGGRAWNSTPFIGHVSAIDRLRISLCDGNNGGMTFCSFLWLRRYRTVVAPTISSRSDVQVWGSFNILIRE